MKLNYLKLWLISIVISISTVYSQNTVLGVSAGAGNDGDKNIFIGNMAGGESTGSFNLAIGEGAGYELSGNYNTILGSNPFIFGDKGIAIGYGIANDLNISNQLLIGVDNNPLIWGDFNTKSITLGRISSTSLSTKITTSYGYLEIGPKNTSYAHIYTDRPSYYFNKRIVVDEGIIASYNENLVFNTDISETRMTINNSTGNVGIGTASPAAKLDVAGDILMGQEGLKGSYATTASTKVQGIWSIGSSWKISTSVNDYGNQYGFVYAHHNAGTNSTKKPIAGWGHQYSIVDNGVRKIVFSGSLGNAYFSGNVGIGIETLPAGFKLAVAGKILAEEIQVSASGTTPWPDFVFAPDYQLKTLNEVECFIKENQHLPDVPSAKEIAEEGISLGEMNALLLQKIEELTLYIIRQQKSLEKQQNEIESLKTENSELKKLSSKIEELELMVKKSN